jgi:hypothetical protein
MIMKCSLLEGGVVEELSSQDEELYSLRSWNAACEELYTQTLGSFHHRGVCGRVPPWWSPVIAPGGALKGHFITPGVEVE